MKRLLLLLTIALLCSCAGEKQKPSIHIVISKEPKPSVADWIEDIDSTIRVTIVYGMPIDSAMQIMKTADGVIITGGNDVNPGQYNRPDYVKHCEKFDNYRDTLEISMIKYAMENKIALLGICRGHQIMNVAQGGTLIPDIETFLKIDEKVHRQRNINDSVHTIIPSQKSWIPAKLYKDGEEIYVNSIHHQSVDQMSDMFVLQATSKDAVVESMIAKDTSLFAIGVQWHPERERDKLATYLGQIFLEASKK